MVGFPGEQSWLMAEFHGAVLAGSQVSLEASRGAAVAA